MQIQLHKQKIINIIGNKTSSSEKLQAICDYLNESISYYDWVGFYFNNDTKAELKLQGFAGEPTEHTTIPFGKGICGQVALTNKNFIVSVGPSQWYRKNKGQVGEIRKQKVIYLEFHYCKVP